VPVNSWLWAVLSFFLFFNSANKNPHMAAPNIGLFSESFHATQTRAQVVYVIVKVECTFVQALRLCTGRTAHRGSRGIALPFLDHSTRRGWGVSVTPRPLFTPRKDLVPIVQEAG
jgi:hypothetical protein